MALEHEIAQFGQRMGMANLAFPPEGPLALDIATVGRVYFERGPGELLLYLARDVPPHDGDAARRILSLCHYGKGHPIPLHGGLHKGQAILISRVAERGAVASFLENAVRYLSERMDGIFRD